MSEFLGVKEDKKEALKELIRRLHRGENPEFVKEKFKEFAQGITAADITQIEEELVEECLPAEEVHKLCDIHIAVFKEDLPKGGTVAPPGHPIHILTSEHEIILKISEELKTVSDKINNKNDFNSADGELKQLAVIINNLKDSESHYLREENVFFPHLEKHGVTQPPKIMWMEHDRIREIKKSLYKIFDDKENTGFPEFSNQLDDISSSLSDMLVSHFFKENHILFSTAMNIMLENEWKDIRREFDRIGYCCFTTEAARIYTEEVEEEQIKELPPEPKVGESELQLETGALTKEEIEGIFSTLPAEITFIDKEDNVKFFSLTDDNIFLRTRSVLGRKVQNCHPEKSINAVNQILKDFKTGKKDLAEFWINLKGKFIYIRYYPVLNRNGEYLGCMEVTQDVTAIKNLSGEKKLL